MDNRGDKRRMIKWNYIWRHLRELTQRLMGRKPSRQPFLITAHDKYVRYFFERLIELGFSPNYFAYYDKDEIYNLRRLKFKEGELWQEHIRIFQDEIRGHFEISYEEDTQRHISGETIKPLSSNLTGAIKRMVE